MPAPRKFLISLMIPTAIMGFIWPFLVPSKNFADKAEWFFLLATLLSVASIVSLALHDEVSSKSIAFLGILTALVAALRPLGVGAIGIEPMWFALIVASRAMGPSFGFLLGALSMFFSALLTGGIGPWLGYQVFGAALIGFMTGVIPNRIRGRLEILLLAIYGAVSAELFGIMMDLQFWPWALGNGTELSFIAGAPVSENLNRFFTYHFLSALAWDIPRAVITVLLILLAGKPILAALRRARHRAAFLTDVEFKELADVRLNHR